MQAQSEAQIRQRWRAVVLRDRAAEFLYAVRTTGIYCRPSCPARLARRANIEFYDGITDAERAGYRPCKRCKPTATYTANTEAMARACQSIRSARIEGKRLSLNELSNEARLTPSHFHRSFKKYTGVTPKQYSLMATDGDAPPRIDENLATELDRALEWFDFDAWIEFPMDQPFET